MEDSGVNKQGQTEVVFTNCLFPQRNMPDKKSKSLLFLEVDSGGGGVWEGGGEGEGVVRAWLQMTD